MSSRRIRTSSSPVQALFAAGDITFGAGVAIFHLASERVVVCWHSRDKYWFLPKGRRNASEDAGRAAEREGFEESGYRNRLLPLPIPHNQPYPDDLPELPIPSFDTEPLWTQLAPQSRIYQYILLWYAAETIPEDDEVAISALATETGPQGDEAALSALPAVPSTKLSPNRDEANLTALPDASLTKAEGEKQLARPYYPPPPFPANLTLRQRIQQDFRGNDGNGQDVYEPKKHKGTGVNEEESWYESALLPVDAAIKCLGGGVQGEVVRQAWEAVKLRVQIEDGVAHSASSSGVGSRDS